MLISTSKKFIFIHNYKVAGTSVRNALKKYESKYFYVASRVAQQSGLIDYKLFKIFDPHVTASSAKSILPKFIYDKYYKFGFVRNPWGWQFSLYSFMLKNKKHYQHEHIKSLGSFGSYLKWRVEYELKHQKDFFYSSNGEKMVDHIGKLETITKDFKLISNYIDITGVELPVLNVSTTNDWVKNYNLDTFNIVKNAFKKDIECFDYSDDPVFYGIEK